MCERHDTAMVLWGQMQRSLFAEVWGNWDKLPPELVVLYDKWKDIEDPRVVIGYKPNMEMPEE